jgi:CHASE1-domain containing sensor protein
MRVGPLAGAGGTLAAYALSAIALATAPITPAAESLAAQAAALAGGLQDEVDAAFTLAAPLRARLRAGEPVDWKSFDASFTESTQRRKAQNMIVWAPQVAAAQRGAVEADSGRDAFRSWNLVETGAQGTPVPAQARAVHHPIALAAPLAPGSELLGLDLASLPELETALAERPSTATAASARATVVGPMTLLPAAACSDPSRLGCRSQIFVVIPVSDGQATSAPAHTDHQLRGAILVGLSWAAITKAARLAGPRAALHPLELSRARAARASFQLLGQPWTLELHVPVGGSLTARLGQASAPRPN